MDVHPAQVSPNSLESSSLPTPARHAYQGHSIGRGRTSTGRPLDLHGSAGPRGVADDHELELVLLADADYVLFSRRQVPRSASFLGRFQRYWLPGVRSLARGRPEGLLRLPYLAMFPWWWRLDGERAENVFKPHKPTSNTWPRLLRACRLEGVHARRNGSRTRQPTQTSPLLGGHAAETEAIEGGIFWRALSWEKIPRWPG